MIEADVIGTLFEAAGDDEAEAVPLPGWHVNITTEGLAARPDLAPFVVTPTTLRRVWAGDDPAAPVVTVALRFADQAAAEAALGG
ncbi:hypothetical protein [Brevundimonas balnearis]|uniref:Uncharacterized protein n=1 Tax=Brevundimonas balnearis TaxID=1572858 RepID=A0ABV6R400_9CAUL